MLRIDIYRGKSVTTICLAGRMRVEHLEQIARILREDSGGNIILDLLDVTIVDIDVVAFLDSCEDRGLTLANCPTYIAEWMHQERLAFCRCHT